MPLGPRPAVTAIRSRSVQTLRLMSATVSRCLVGCQAALDDHRRGTSSVYRRDVSREAWPFRSASSRLDTCG